MSLVLSLYGVNVLVSHGQVKEFIKDIRLVKKIFVSNEERGNVK